MLLKRLWAPRRRGNAFADLPPPPSRQAGSGGGRKLLTSPLPLAPPLPHYQSPSMPTVGQVCDRLADSPPAYSDTADKAFCMKWPRCDSCFKFITSSSDINIGVNYEGLIYIQRKAGVLKGKKINENLSDVICVLLWIKAKRKMLADILSPFYLLLFWNTTPERKASLRSVLNRSSFRCQRTFFCR